MSKFDHSIALASGLLLSLASSGASAILIDNDIPAGTPGHFEMDVTDAGESTNGSITGVGTPSGNTITDEIIFGYESFVDVGTNGGGFNLRRRHRIT